MNVLILIFATISLVGFTKGLKESLSENAYGQAGIFNIIGAFVWGDAAIFGLFWTAVSAFVLLTKDYTLFMLILSIFWAVRSFGEIIYWLNQQFSKVKRVPPENLWFFKYFKNDSVWFIYQIYWQCILTVSIVSSIYFAKIW